MTSDICANVKSIKKIKINYSREGVKYDKTVLNNLCEFPFLGLEIIVSILCENLSSISTFIPRVFTLMQFY